MELLVISCCFVCFSLLFGLNVGLFFFSRNSHNSPVKQKGALRERCLLCTKEARTIFQFEIRTTGLGTFPAKHRRIVCRPALWPKPSFLGGEIGFLNVLIVSCRFIAPLFDRRRSFVAPFGGGGCGSCAIAGSSVGVGSISPRAFRKRIVRYWHPLRCRANQLGKPPQGCVIHCTHRPTRYLLTYVFRSRAAVSGLQYTAVVAHAGQIRS